MRFFLLSFIVLSFQTSIHLTQWKVEISGGKWLLVPSEMPPFGGEVGKVGSLHQRHKGLAPLMDQRHHREIGVGDFTKAIKASAKVQRVVPEADSLGRHAGLQLG